MAYKKYADYNKGNKIALIEKADSTSSGFLAVAHCTLGGYTTKDTCEAAGGQWIPGSGGSIETVGEYKSPASTVAKGLEIEYTYAPTYNIQSTGTNASDYFRFIGWGSNGTNLVLFTHGNTLAGVYNLSSKFSANDWIVIKGSGRWSGLHQVKETGSTQGVLTLKTKCNFQPNIITAVCDIEADDETIRAEDADGSKILEVLKDSYLSNTGYIYITGTATAGDTGFYKADFTSAASEAPIITVTNKYFFEADGGDLTNSAPSVTDADDDTIQIYKANLDEMEVFKSVDVMEDETFELDLTRYQANAVILYMRSKLAEEMGNIELYEYYTAKFTKQLEKASGSRKYGPHIVQGHGMTRK